MELTRRERYRRQTIDEIKQAAMSQLERGGESAVSLNAIAKTMAMSPGALYRYFDNRDDLVADLVVDAYADLARHLEHAADNQNRDVDAAGAKVAGVAAAYRGWALDNPNRYRLIFETTSGSGWALAAERVVPTAQRSMNVFLGAIAASGPAPQPSLPQDLSVQVKQWGTRADPSDLPPSLLHLALSFWFRLHGLVSLEIGHHLEAIGITTDALFAAEVDDLLRAISAG